MVVNLIKFLLLLAVMSIISQFVPFGPFINTIIVLAGLWVLATRKD